MLGLGKREGKSEGYSREFEGNRTQCDIEQSGSVLRKVFSHFFVRQYKRYMRELD